MKRKFPQTWYQKRTEIATKKRLNTFFEIDNQYGKIIEDSIINHNKCIQDIYQILSNYGTKMIRYYLKYKNLESLALQNGIKLRNKKAADQWRKNAKMQTIKAQERILNLPKITNKAIKIYTDGLKNDLFSREIRKKLKKINQECNYHNLRKIYGNIKKGHGGKRNSMYGKPAPLNSGFGITGHILINGKKIFFRSSLELSIYIYLSEKNIKFSLSKHRIKYRFNNKDKTYCPDIVINNIIYEIKPKKLIELEINKIKFITLKNYCKKFNLKCEYITENTFDIKNILTKIRINKLIEDEKLFLVPKQKIRLDKMLK